MKSIVFKGTASEVCAQIEKEAEKAKGKTVAEYIEEKEGNGKEGE